MKLAHGLERPDSGRIEVDGQPVKLGSPRDAEATGIAMIPQELDLFLELTVAENLYVGRARPRTGWRGIDHRAMRRSAQERLAEIGIELDCSVRGGHPLGRRAPAGRRRPGPGRRRADRDHG